LNVDIVTVPLVWREHRVVALTEKVATHILAKLESMAFTVITLPKNVPTDPPAQLAELLGDLVWLRPLRLGIWSRQEDESGYPFLLRSRDYSASVPLTGSEADIQLLDPTLEIEPVVPARFDLPKIDDLATQDAA